MESARALCWLLLVDLKIASNLPIIEATGQK